MALVYMKNILLSVVKERKREMKYMAKNAEDNINWVSLSLYVGKRAAFPQCKHNHTADFLPTSNEMPLLLL